MNRHQVVVPFPVEQEALTAHQLAIGKVDVGLLILSMQFDIEAAKARYAQDQEMAAFMDLQ